LGFWFAGYGRPRIFLFNMEHVSRAQEPRLSHCLLISPQWLLKLKLRLRLTQCFQSFQLTLIPSTKYSPKWTSLKLVTSTSNRLLGVRAESLLHSLSTSVYPVTVTLMDRMDIGSYDQPQLAISHRHLRARKLRWQKVSTVLPLNYKFISISNGIQSNK
jgi:hypothetical protein